MRNVIHSLSYGFENVGLRSDIEQTLVGFRVLNNGLRLAIDRENHRPFGPLEAFHELGGLASKRRQRLDVLGNVKHGQSFPSGTFKGALVRAVCKEKMNRPTSSSTMPIWLVLEP